MANITYNIYRRYSKTEKPLPVATGLANLEYKISNVDYDRDVYISVSKVIGKLEVFGEEYKYFIPFQTPTVTATYSTGVINITWNNPILVEEMHLYISSNPITEDLLPPSIPLNITSKSTSINRVLADNELVYIRIGTVRNNKMKLSGETYAFNGTAWTPDDLQSAKIYLLADDVNETGNIIEWVCRKTGIKFTQATAANQPKADNTLGYRMCKFDSTDTLETKDVAITSMMSNVSSGYIFSVAKRDVDYTATSSRSIFLFLSNTTNWRFGLGFDEGNSYLNRFIVGARRLDADSWTGLASTTTFDKNPHIVYGDTNHTSTTNSLIIDGQQLLSANTTKGVGVTSNTPSASVRIGGAIDGMIGTIVFGNDIPEIMDRLRLEGWAAHKYGLTSNLPDNHPFRYKPPLMNEFVVDHTAEFNFTDNSMHINWNGIGDYDEVRYYKSTEPLTNIQSYDPITTVTDGSVEYIDADVIPGVTYYTAVGIFQNNDLKYSSHATKTIPNTRMNIFVNNGVIVDNGVEKATLNWVGTPVVDGNEIVLNGTQWINIYNEIFNFGNNPFDVEFDLMFTNLTGYRMLLNANSYPNNNYTQFGTNTGRLFFNDAQTQGGSFTSGYQFELNTQYTIGLRRTEKNEFMMLVNGDIIDSKLLKPTDIINYNIVSGGTRLFNITWSNQTAPFIGRVKRFTLKI